LRAALGEALPTRDDALLLRACLAPREVAQPAWATWRARHGDDRGAFAPGHPGRRRLRPLLARAAAAQHVDLADDRLRRELTVVAAKEDLRAAAVARVAGEVIAVLTGANVRHVTTLGVWVAASVYPAFGLRHVHDVDLIIDAEAIPIATAALVASGDCDAGPGSRRGPVTLLHRSGLPVNLLDRPFPAPFRAAGADALWTNARAAAVGGSRTLVPSPATLLVHLCVWGYLTGSRTLTWAPDAWFVLGRAPDVDRHDAVDWREVEDVAAAHGVELPVSRALAYLVDQLDVPIPEQTLIALDRAAESTDRARRDASLRAAWSATRLRRRNGTDSPAVRSRLVLFRSALLPAPSYLRATGQPTRLWNLPGSYLRPPVRALAGRVRSRGGSLLRRR
jgi:hypothetical protein